ncbi:MAG: hypothetical protein R8G66_22795 [Cytophagales bacterium]|nr:hypothetical protein [Cytophagales bacterium]
MLEKDCPRNKRFLPIHCHITKEQFPTEELIHSWRSGDSVDQYIQKYLHWEKAENELVAYCGYGYAEVAVPKSYDYLIDQNDPIGGFEVKATVTQVLMNTILPYDRIVHGYKMVCIITFEKEVPAVLGGLSHFEVADMKRRFGLCAKADKELILDRLSQADPLL